MAEPLLNKQEAPLETHPWPPFIPAGAKVLIMGTFPPQPHRWAMDFYYPNRTNDFWKIMGLIFHNDQFSLYNPDSKSYNLDQIISLCTSAGIALNDTGYKVRRLANNASDKYLEIIEPVNLHGLLTQMPDCRAIATTGEKAAGIIAGMTGTQIPKIGHFIKDSNGMEIWRMPSTSRAYPLPLEQKADYYRTLFRDTGVIKF